MELCTPLITKGGCDLVFVMPNLQPPITKVADAISYHEKLSRLAPNVTFLMSLFLHPDLNASVIAEAARSKVIYGVLSFPTMSSGQQSMTLLICSRSSSIQRE
jgi:dihydroorotase